MLERTATLRWVAALLGLTMLVGCTSLASSGRKSTPTTAVTATGSPGSGQPKEYNLTGSCVPTIVPPPSSPGLAATTWPTEHADVWRTHAAAAGLPAGLGQMKLHTATATLPPVPVWGYVGTGREVYVMGGAPYLLDMFTKLIEAAPRASVPLLLKQSQAYSKTTTPYVARVDTQTMKVQVLYLSDGKSANYTGGLLVHSYGYLYAVARSVLYKIDPSTFTIVKTRQLPLAPTSSGSPNEKSQSSATGCGPSTR